MKKTNAQLKMGKNRENILSFFNTNVEFYRTKELRKIYDESINKKFVYSSTTFAAFLKFLIENNVYEKKVILDFPSKKYTRYFVKTPSLYKSIQSISTKAYFSHYSAVEYHNLTNNLPKTIFISIEKSKYELPSSLSFLEMYDVGKVEQLNSSERWKNHRTGKS